MSAAVALRRVHWYHPEAETAAVAAGAWLVLLVAAAGPGAGGDFHAAAHDRVPLLAGASGWLLMTVAMMVPAALPVARDHALGALWARRGRTVRLFLASYVAVWAVFGAIAAAGVSLVEHLGVGMSGLLAATLFVGAGWELTAAKWRSVRACHQISPLPPRGGRADRACARAGATYGRRCVAACWAPMLAMAVAGHASMGLMVLLSVVIAAEKYLARPARFAVPLAAVLASAGLVSYAS